MLSRSENHKYFLDDIEVPGVTSVINEFLPKDFSKVNPDVLRRSIEFGIAVHSALTFLEQGDLDEATLDPEIQSRVWNWLYMKELCGIEIDACAQQFHSKKHVYAGEVDFIGTQAGTPCVFDLKTGQVPWTEKLQ